MRLHAAASLLFIAATALLGASPQRQALAQDSLQAGGFNFTGCPEWLPRYIKFHKEQRENASAQRLTWTDETGGAGLGYGDRLRALVHGVKAAASSNRVFHARWMHAPLDIFKPFKPNLIDWRPLPGQESVSSGVTPNEAKDASPRSIFYSGNPYCSWDPPSWVFAPPSQWANTSNDHSVRDQQCGCIFRALIQPSDELNKLIDEEQARVLPSGTVNYTAIHYRTYTGLKGEGEDLPLDKQLLNVTQDAPLLATVSCARRHSGNLTIFMAISDVRIRRAIKQGLIPGVVGPSQEWAIHPNSNGDRDISARPKPDEHMHTFVELGVLWRATYGVWSTSGFSNLARWMQGRGPEYQMVISRNPKEPGCFTFKERGGPDMI